jgi:hypothetical protein
MIVYWEKYKEKENNSKNNLDYNNNDNNLKNIENNIVNINDFIDNSDNLDDEFDNQSSKSSNFNQSFISNKSFHSFFNDSFDNIKKENEDFLEKENIIKIQNNKNIYNIDYCNDENIYLNNENINLKIYKTLPIEEKKMFINKNSKFLLLSQIGSEFLINIIYSERLEIINIILYLIIEKFSLYKNNNFTKNIIKALYTSNNYFILKNLLLSNINL